MSDANMTDTLEIAALPLADGRKLALPLLALAEVQQIRADDEAGFGHIKWRGHDLEITSLEAFCGLEPPAVSAHTTVGIFRAEKNSDEPFRALAFCGLAAHRHINPGDLTSTEVPETGCFSAAAEMGGEIYLIPDLPKLLFKPAGENLH